MRLFIAEKPSLGRAIAQFLPVKGTPVGRTHIVGGNDVVTWCFGHLFEMAQPEHYGEQYKKWTVESLPIVPSDWTLVPRPEAKDQLKAIKTLLSQCTEIVNAGDPDREGQLLVDELLEFYKNKKPVKRIWLSALDEGSVKKALGNLTDNSNFSGLKASAESRQRGDWLVGMNLTRAYTLAGQKSGYEGVLSIGRVQTPTLNLIVKRDESIENFKPVDFFSVVININSVMGLGFNARWKPQDGVSLADGRLLAKSIADTVAAKVEGKSGVVIKFEALDKKTPAPLPFSLSSLQLAASKKLGLGAQDVLNIVQELYESKLTTYPRTDCNYLPESQFDGAAKILSQLPSEYTDLVRKSNSKLKSQAWNDGKVTAHHAIIPTGTRSELSGTKAQVYDLIVRAFLAQFFAPYTFKETTVHLDICDEIFTAKGIVPTSPGWKAIFGNAEDDDVSGKEKEKADSQALPVLVKGDKISCAKACVESKKTTPPARFTEGTLIQAMTNIHQLVEDPEIKKRLKETSGIGTEATRAGIIETLKKRGFISEQKKNVVSTVSGRKLIHALPEQVKSPGLTGLFEQLLDGIAEKRITPEQFLSKQIEYVTKYVELSKTIKLAISGGGKPVIETPRAKSARRPPSKAAGTSVAKRVSGAAAL